jgi:hypothetical protein
MTAIFFHKEMKVKLKTGEAAVICDLSENYSVILDEITVFQ